MKLNKAMILCGILLCIGLRVISQQSNTLTLKQAVETAITNNLDVKQSELQMETAGINRTRAKANRFPYLEGFAFHGANQGRSIDPVTNQFVSQQINYANYGINTGVLLFNGLSIHNNIKSNNLAHEASKMEWQQNKDNLTLNVILAYLQVLNNTDLLGQSRNQAELSRRQVERLQILNELGAIPPSQFYDLKGQLASDELSITNTQNSLDGARLLLSQLMNVPYDNTLQVERISIDQFTMDYGSTPEQIYQVALEQLALVKGASLRRQSAARNVKSVRGELYPTISLNGNLTTNYSSAAFQDILIGITDQETNNYVKINGVNTPVFTPVQNFNFERIAYRSQLDNNLFTSVNLGLRIPIFNALQTRSRLRLAKIAEKNSLYIEETTRIQLKQNIEQAYFNMTAAQNRYKSITEQVAAFAESFRAAEERFNAGIGAAVSVEYLVAKNNLDRANISLIQARYDYVLRTRILDYYQSKPVW